MRYRLDSTWTRVGEGQDIVLAGSPLRLFRLGRAGVDVVARIETGADVQSVLADRLADAGAIHPAPGETGGGLSIDDIAVVTPQLGGALAADGRVTVDDGSQPPIDGADVRLSANRGPSAARNAGRRAVDAALLMFVDADIDLGFDLADRAGFSAWCAPLLAHFDDSTVGLVAPRVTGDERSSLDLGNESARIRAGTRVSYVPAAAILVRASAFDDIGGFDEQMRLGEDVDFVWRLDQAGWRCRYEPSATVRHERRATLAARMRQQVGYGSSSAALALRHPGAVAPITATPWTAGAWMVGALGRPIGAAMIGFAGAAATVRRVPDVPGPVMLRQVALAQGAGVRQLARAMRRAWWPLLLAACLVSRRARAISAVAVASAPLAAPYDITFGWGVWKGMLRHRTSRPLWPKIIDWK